MSANLQLPVMPGSAASSTWIELATQEPANNSTLTFYHTLQAVPSNVVVRLRALVSGANGVEAGMEFDLSNFASDRDDVHKELLAVWVSDKAVFVNCFFVYDPHGDVSITTFNPDGTQRYYNVGFPVGDFEVVVRIQP